MFRKLIVVLVGAVLLGAAWAQGLGSVERDVTVNMPEIVGISLSDGENPVLDLVADGGVLTDTAWGGTLRVDFNRVGTWFVVATVVDESTILDHDISLSVQWGAFDDTPLVVDGTVVSAATDDVEDQAELGRGTVVDAESAFFVSAGLTWTATATAAGTMHVEDGYVFEVTFTLLSDDEEDDG